MSDADKITFPSYVHTTYERKAIGILRQIYLDIVMLMSEGVTREQIYEALTNSPYSIDMKWRYFTTALSRIKKESENQSFSKKVVPSSKVKNNTRDLPKTSSALKGLGSNDWTPNPNKSNVMGEPLDD